MAKHTSHATRQPHHRTAVRTTVKESRSHRPAQYALTIFLSHKSHDHSRAMALKNAFEMHSAGRVRVFVSGQDIIPGGRWEQTIHENLRNSDMFILLFTDPADNWNWPLYEGGYFAAKMQRAKDRDLEHIPNRLICLHHPDVRPPDPLQSWQSLPAQPNKIANFLRETYAKVNPPLVTNEAARPDFDRFVAMIIEQVPGVTAVSHTFTHEFSVRLTPQNMLDLKSRRRMPESARLQIGPDTLREVFGLASPGQEHEWSWEQFVQSLSANPAHGAQLRWIEHLPHAIARLNDRQTGTPILPLLRQIQPQHAESRPILYRPIILERNQVADQWTSFRIILARTLDSMTPSDEADRLFFLLLQARNASCAILPSCRNDLRLARVHRNEAMTELILHEVWSDVQISHIEALNRGLFLPEQIAELFAERDRPDVLRLIENYRQALEEFNAGVQNADASATSAALDEIYRICSGFQRRIATRYVEVMAPPIKTKDADDVTPSSPLPPLPKMPAGGSVTV